MLLAALLVKAHSSEALDSVETRGEEEVLEGHRGSEEPFEASFVERGYFVEPPAARVGIDLVVTPPHLHKLVHEPQAVLLLVALHTMHDVHDCLFLAQVQLKLSNDLELLRIHNKQESRGEEHNVSV